MPYKSDLTGIKIENEVDMITVTICDVAAEETVIRYVKDLTELKAWWVAGKPNNGGSYEESDHEYAEITDEKLKISLVWKGQTFTFKDVAEATAWYNEVSGP